MNPPKSFWNFWPDMKITQEQRDKNVLYCKAMGRAAQYDGSGENLRLQ